MIKRRWRTILQDVKTRPSADCGSDHQMLLGKLKLRLKSKKTTAQPVRFDVMNIPAQFTTEIGNRFMPLLQMAEEDVKPEVLWASTSDVLKKTAQEYIPRKKRQKQAWLTTSTMEIASKRRQAKSEGRHADWRQLNKEYNQKACEDKRAFLEGKCEEMGNAAKKHKMKKVFKLVKRDYW